MSSITSVDAINNLIVVVVENVSGTETKRWATGVDVVPVVVVVCDAEVSSVFGGVGVGVANEGCLPVVVDVGVGDSDKVGGVGEIDQAIVVVLVMVLVGGDVDVVDPDVGGLLFTGISIFSKSRERGATYGHRWHRHWQLEPWQHRCCG